MPWGDLCTAYANGTINSHNFRRFKPVTNVVETVGLSDARFYTERIMEWGGEFLEDARVETIDDWGNPIRCPRCLIGTKRAYSPTTLRYLATALWLKRARNITPDTRIVEIGVGYGGLAAMNAVVSGARTILVDLPQVVQTAMKMLGESALEGYGLAITDNSISRTNLIISNYAFTELSSDLQDIYLEQYLRHADHGVIISNASVFASTIQGRCDEELVKWLNASAIPATIENSNELLSPIDSLCGVSMIRW
jgi:hypothetical protein